ncbi:hypothetical protein LCH33_000043 [Pseudomonas amygdali]|uniref:hypothetical protein n=1 Tax=Pseudomonas amygdali TaxID=47877 RepID=UPI0007107851|nr:hypothetical protein [Pseudomonas amygdali]UBT76748.1 hypothetical protein LCH33_000043 [Pseudomonas amygdali]
MYTLLLFALFAVLLLAFHYIGFKLRGKVSRQIWKSGDYLWLSMAMFALIGGGYEARKAISADIIESSRIAIVDNLKEREENVRLATDELLKIVNYNDLSKVDDGPLGELASQAVQLDTDREKTSEKQSDAKQSQNKNWFEIRIVYFYPFVLAIALALRITLASADIFDWYKKPVTLKEKAEKSCKTKTSDAHVGDDALGVACIECEKLDRTLEADCDSSAPLTGKDA